MCPTGAASSTGEGRFFSSFFLFFKFLKHDLNLECDGLTRGNTAPEHLLVVFALLSLPFPVRACERGRARVCVEGGGGTSQNFPAGSCRGLACLMRRLLAGIFRRRWNSSIWGNWGFSTGAALSASLFVAFLLTLSLPPITSSPCGAFLDPEGFCVQDK